MKLRKKSLSQSFIFLSECRGEHCSSAEKRSFSDFPKENNLFFRLAATDFAWAKSADDQWSPLRIHFRPPCFQDIFYLKTTQIPESCYTVPRRKGGSYGKSDVQGLYALCSAFRSVPGEISYRLVRTLYPSPAETQTARPQGLPVLSEANSIKKSLPFRAGSDFWSGWRLRPSPEPGCGW